jgi:phthalate 4,5-dioxygenase oxygenase subunit
MKTATSTTSRIHTTPRRRSPKKPHSPKKSTSDAVPTICCPTSRCVRTWPNDYGIDRRQQKTFSFTGIKGVNTQDVALQEGMGPIVDRTKEHLGTTDRAIIALRQLLLEATRAAEDGADVRGTDPAAYRHVRPVDHKIARGLDWHETLADELQAKF